MDHVNRPIIEARGVSKSYRLGMIGATSLRDELARGWQRLRGREPVARYTESTPHSTPSSAGSRHNGREFWALRDVSFDVQPGEIVGVIGRNGAGKSTLLKILSRITRPTAGEIVLRARVASLLEVGTGFHPDLTGRENVYLNGAILGMTKAEIRGKFDEIVAFAELDEFIDTPVKRYSSGMYVRLAFAVAAHLEPEILIVDEVLAVGDANFQKKCLGKMEQVASREGRTVLFVSHNMAAVQSLCSRAIWLDEGRVVADGERGDIIRRYLSAWNDTTNTELADRTDRTGDGSVRLESVTVVAEDGGSLITSASRIKIALRYRTTGPVNRPRVLIGIYADNEVGIYGLDSEASGELPVSLPASGTVVCTTAPINLTAGPCSLNIAVYNRGALADYIPHAVQFNVEADDFYGTGKTPSRSWMVGLVHHDWNLVGD